MTAKGRERPPSRLLLGVAGQNKGTDQDDGKTRRTALTCGLVSGILGAFTAVTEV